MPAITFDVLPDQSSAARDHYACVLAEQAVKQGQHVFIRTRDREHSQRIDALLWSFRDNSFVPHHRLDHQPSPAPAAEGSVAAAHTATETSANAPVLISSGDTVDQRCADAPITLINLADDAAAHFERYALVFEIVCDQEASKQSSRELFRHYRAQGFPPQHRTLRQRVLSQY